MRVDKPWGWYEVISQQPNATIKILCINPGMRLSNQYHSKRSEYLIPFSGEGGVDLGVTPTPDAAVARKLLRPGLSAFVPVGHVHRIFCSPSSPGPLMITEVWMGEYLEEADITRIADDFGRS